MVKRTVEDSIQALLHDARIIPELTDLLTSGSTCYLVGGALRNARLGLPVADFDFALSADPTKLAREFAARIGGHWFSLDAVRRQSRVVVKTVSGPVTYDFAPWRAATIEEDLKLRDYTVNAMALPLKQGDRRPGQLLDPLGGCSDLQARLLRCCSATVLRDDPLRVLKGFRHCMALELAPDEDTFAKMIGAAPRLELSAPERIRSELGQIFAEPDDEGRFDLFGQLGLPAVLFGPPDASGSFADGWEMIRRVRNWMRLLADLDKEGRVLGLLDDRIEEYWPRRAVLKLAAFLAGYWAQNIETLARKRLRLGRRATVLLKGLTDLKAERYQEMDRLSASSRGRALWVDSLGPDRGEALVLLAVLAKASDSETPHLLELLSDYQAVAGSQGRIADLVSGDWVRDELRIEGPRVGELMKQVRCAEIEGRVSDTDEAKRFLRQFKH